ncbi:hypothetical protein C8R41DRAFT_144400 [Lentinula lateritia]|uniref:Uncharacterized protein n=1 Tax=Lentinula lateritia TaxID=40482 RepID=A0ABQ8UW88_9AGAR|nr:hypothetical protein C8R41DRAFT_144400 [Lentinula lateritia]
MARTRIRSVSGLVILIFTSVLGYIYSVGTICTLSCSTTRTSEVLIIFVYSLQIRSQNCFLLTGAILLMNTIRLQFSLIVESLTLIPMATTLSNVPSFPDERCLRGPDNWKQFKDYVISAVRSKGLAGYLDGTIKLPMSATAADAKTTPLNSTSPSQEEWQFREGHVSGLIYQNIVDPDSHSIGPEDAAVTMWSTLKGKFELISMST